MAEKLVDDAINRQTDRVHLSQTRSKESLLSLTAADFSEEDVEATGENIEGVLTKLDQVENDVVKTTICLTACSSDCCYFLTRSTNFIKRCLALSVRCLILSLPLVFASTFFFLASSFNWLR